MKSLATSFLSLAIMASLLVPGGKCVQTLLGVACCCTDVAATEIQPEKAVKTCSCCTNESGLEAQLSVPLDCMVSPKPCCPSFPARLFVAQVDSSSFAFASMNSDSALLISPDYFEFVRSNDGLESPGLTWKIPKRTELLYLKYCSFLS